MGVDVAGEILSLFFIGSLVFQTCGDKVDDGFVIGELRERGTEIYFLDVDVVDELGIVHQLEVILLLVNHVFHLHLLVLTHPRMVQHLFQTYSF